MKKLEENKFYIFLVLLFIDFTTKVFASKTNWTFHVTGNESLIKMAAVVLFVALPMYFIGKVFGAILLAGVAGNMSWAVLYGGVPNPFVVPIFQGYLAFNMADIYISTMILPISVIIVLTLNNFLKNGIRKKNTENSSLP